MIHLHLFFSGLIAFAITQNSGTMTVLLIRASESLSAYGYSERLMTHHAFFEFRCEEYQPLAGTPPCTDLFQQGGDGDNKHPLNRFGLDSIDTNGFDISVDATSPPLTLKDIAKMPDLRAGTCGYVQPSLVDMTKDPGSLLVARMELQLGSVTALQPEPFLWTFIPRTATSSTGTGNEVASLLKIDLDSTSDHFTFTFKPFNNTLKAYTVTLKPEKGHDTVQAWLTNESDMNSYCETGFEMGDTVDHYDIYYLLATKTCAEKDKLIPYAQGFGAYKLKTCDNWKSTLGSSAGAGRFPVICMNAALTHP